MHEDEALQRETTAYEQKFETFRSMNQIMWQVPMIAVTLTGGLWYAVATLKGVNAEVREVLLGFSVLANILLIVMINRVRDVMDVYLDSLTAFHPPSAPASAPRRWWSLWMSNRVVCTMFSTMMALAAIVSAIGVYFVWAGRWILVC